MIVTTAITVGIWAPDTMKRFLADTPFALTGTMNWWLVGRELDYFETIGRPPLLQHTWSLAVEAQFYLIWPLILLLILKWFGKKRVAMASLFFAAISGTALLLVSLRLDANNASSVSHIYFGTDTHSIGLFLGAALAVSWVPQNFKEVVSKKAQDFIDAIGVVGFIGILGTFLLIDADNPSLYKIAFPLAGLFGAAIVTSIVHPASRFAPILQNRVLLWIGERSYAIYIWHWIIFQVTRPDIDLAGQDWALLALRILIVLALADISLRYIELPVRRGVIKNWIKGRKYRTPDEKKIQTRRISIASFIVICLVGVVSFRAVTISQVAQNTLREEFTSETPVAEVAQTGIWLTGDSVILGIRNSLGEQFPVALVNARIGRQADELLEVILKDKANAPVGPVVLNMGNNGALTKDQVMAIFEALSESEKVIVVNTAVPRGWRDENNRLIAEIAQQYPNISVVDWNLASADHPEYFAPDGVHLVPEGVAVYISEIARYL
jgi:peptidoglycan/LPS O-acetylase OafA/YrhL